MTRCSKIVLKKIVVSENIHIFTCFYEIVNCQCHCNIIIFPSSEVVIVSATVILLYSPLVRL